MMTDKEFEKLKLALARADDRMRRLQRKFYSVTGQWWVRPLVIGESKDADRKAD